MRELAKLRKDNLEMLFHQLANSRYSPVRQPTKEWFINEILHLEGLDMQVLA